MSFATFSFSPSSTLISLLEPPEWWGGDAAATSRRRRWVAAAARRLLSFPKFCYILVQFKEMIASYNKCLWMINHRSFLLLLLRCRCCHLPLFFFLPDISFEFFLWNLYHLDIHLREFEVKCIFIDFIYFLLFDSCRFFNIIFIVFSSYLIPARWRRKTLSPK